MFTKVRQWIARERKRQAAIEATIDAIGRDACGVLPVSVATTAVQLRRRLKEQRIHITFNEACWHIERRYRQGQRSARKWLWFSQK